MTETQNIKASGYYLFESKSNGRNCYFENAEEISLFEVLLKRYLSKYIAIHKLHISTEGYRLLLKVKSRETLIKHYALSCKRKGKEIKKLYENEPWRIISEQIRIFHSLYVKTVNRMRKREGVLVQRKYRKYYFDSKEEYEAYIIKMQDRCEIIGQRNERYRVEKRWVKGVKWALYHGKKWVEKYMDKAFQNYVVSNLILKTKTSHSPHFSPEIPPPPK